MSETKGLSKPDASEPGKPLSEAAKRALAEAEARRQAQAEKERDLGASREIHGRGGKDPVRYNDWESKGIASDF